MKYNYESYSILSVRGSFVINLCEDSNYQNRHQILEAALLYLFAKEGLQQSRKKERKLWALK